MKIYFSCNKILRWAEYLMIECDWKHAIPQYVEGKRFPLSIIYRRRRENIAYCPVSLAGPSFAKARSTSSLTCLHWTLQKINNFPKIYRKHSQIHTEPAIQHPEFFKDGNQNRKGTNYLTTRRRIGSNDEQSLCKLSTFRASTITLQENSKTFWDKFQQGFQVSTS